ncbi:hypothetical protein GF339_22195 [candidate division KSB3 bacterium]|uniref:2-amino-thiazoline-4-carboxylic acid hydrolase n=1 Tax=candidate division KSB3 bacterium TaxID=2044937 RepID=A0A9D5Q8B9_9BACT|nr:hypothetical protein [candidate division KSB3 bacterium]MBD3327313.1 hypothetical protein [candidate division KSB3 bacterium]
MLARREIEARIAVPLIEAFAEEVGHEKALDIVTAVIQTLAQQSGKQLADALGGNSIADFAEGIKYWQRDDALTIELVEHTDTALAFNVVKCRYADMYRELGYQDFGYLLSCNRDMAMVAGFNPNMSLTRTQTIMEGHRFCDFRYQLHQQA